VDKLWESSIGWITNPASLNPYNRGAMGQIQANAVANNGYTWQNILKYFYGNDIIMAQSQNPVIFDFFSKNLTKHNH